MYVATPKMKSAGAILVLHSWWGLNGFFRRLCDRFAEQGFVALAPDLYDGRVAGTIAEAKALRARVTATRREPAYKYLMRMIGELKREAGAEAIGVVGFSMGGHWAWWLAQRPELTIVATVSFYAARDGNYASSRSAFQAHFAGTDEWVSAAGIRKLRRSLEKAGKTFESHTYAGTGHWFFEEDRSEAFHPKSAALAWTRTLGFLRQRLGKASQPQPEEGT